MNSIKYMYKFFAHDYDCSTNDIIYTIRIFNKKEDLYVKYINDYKIFSDSYKYDVSNCKYISPEDSLKIFIKNNYNKHIYGKRVVNLYIIELDLNNIDDNGKLLFVM